MGITNSERFYKDMGKGMLTAAYSIEETLENLELDMVVYAPMLWNEAKNEMDKAKQSLLNSQKRLQAMLRWIEGQERFEQEVCGM